LFSIQVENVNKNQMIN